MFRRALSSSRLKSAGLLPTWSVVLLLLAGSFALAFVGSIFRGAPGRAAPRSPQRQQNEAPHEDASEAEKRAFAQMLDRDFPLHAYVTGVQMAIRKEPKSDSIPVGWLRLGGELRLRAEPASREGCSHGFYSIYPQGFVCVGQGIELRSEAPADFAELAPHRSEPLPYRYLFVKEEQVPEYHNPPSREEQRAASEHATRYMEFVRAEDTARAERLRASALPGEPAPPLGVARWLEHGFFVSANGLRVRSQRRFVRTVRGTYVKEAQLEERTGSRFRGVELSSEHSLPVAWMLRTAKPLTLIRNADGAARLVEGENTQSIERLSTVEWKRRERVGDQIYHVLGTPAGERYLRDYYLTVAEPVAALSNLAEDEPWVHVDISSQTLVLYRGSRPVYATLVSTGLTGHDTPVGEFTIRRKFVSDTMSDIGPESDSRYRIEDVPWTQYFQGSFALHAAFWHGQFGFPHSHGCVNIAPFDAQVVFMHTWPQIPEGWHGASTEQTEFRGSRVLVTP